MSGGGGGGCTSISSSPAVLQQRPRGPSLDADVFPVGWCDMDTVDVKGSGVCVWGVWCVWGLRVRASLKRLKQEPLSRSPVEPVGAGAGGTRSGSSLTQDGGDYWATVFWLLDLNIDVLLRRGRTGGTAEEVWGRD